jgi:hypothetical protein
MPGTSITITDAPTLLAAAKSRDQRALIYVDNHSDSTIFFAIGPGSSGVTTTNGRRLDSGERIMIYNTQTDSEATGALYAIVATGTATVLVTEGN